MKLSRNSTGSILLNRPEASRWIEIRSIIQGAVNLPDAERTLLKQIGLLNLIAGPRHFRASEQLLQLALFRPGQQTLDSQRIARRLQQLCEQGLVHYRRYANEYRLWEGTDVDIPRAIELHKERLMELPLTALLERTAPPALLPAARHACQTGTLRCFEGRWSRLTQLEEVLHQPLPPEADGLLLYCLGPDTLPALPARTPDGHPHPIPTPRALSGRLSDLCDECYHAAPVIHSNRI